MKKSQLFLRATECIILSGFFFFSSAIAEDTDVLPEPFAGSDNVLSKLEEIKFWQYRDEVTVKSVDEKGSEGSVRGRLVDSEDQFGAWPHTPAQLRSMLKLPAEDEDPQLRKPLDGIFERPLEIGDLKTEPKTSIGPIRLRKSFGDWDKKLADVSGATLSYENNRLSNSSTWNSAGSLIYPITISENAKLDSDSMFLNYSLAVLPSVSWKFADVSTGPTGDVEELQFQLPLFFAGNHRLGQPAPGPGDVDDPNHTGGPNQYRSEFSFSPFYLTDLSFDGATVGAAFVYEPFFQLGKYFEVGQYHSLTGDTSLAYLLRLQAKADWGSVLEGSEFIKRPADDDFARVGARIELGFRPFGKKARWEIKGAYQFMQDLTGSVDDFSDLWEVKSTFWLDQAQHVGLSFSYEIGETPVAAKEIDLWTIGFEVKL